MFDIFTAFAYAIKPILGTKPQAYLSKPQTYLFSNGKAEKFDRNLQSKFDFSYFWFIILINLLVFWCFLIAKFTSAAARHSECLVKQEAK